MAKHFLSSLVTTILIFPLLAIGTQLSFDSKIIYIHSHGSDSLCQKERSTPCESFEGAKSLLLKYRNDVVIKVQTDIALSSVFEITDFRNISIFGNNSKIVCNGKDAGFKISNVLNFTFAHLTIINCARQYGQELYQYSSAMLITTTINIQLMDVKFTNCTSTALVFLNNGGQVTIKNAAFGYNPMFSHRSHQQHVNISYPGAINIEQTIMVNKSAVNYSISNCSFNHNKSPPKKNYVMHNFSMNDPIKFRGYGYGGALFIVFGGNVNGSSFIIQDTNFTNNTGSRGGGVYAYYEGNASDNTICMQNLLFEGNGADVSGGGLNVGYYNSVSLRNSIYINQCRFINNHALFGAGLSIFSIHDQHPLQNDFEHIIIQDCIWQGNWGVLSSSVDIGPEYHDKDASGYLPVPKFINCTFLSNYLYNALKSGTKSYHLNTGSFLVKLFTVIFQGNTTFCSNTYSALILVSAKIEFASNSNVLFSDNTGYNGGAIVMYDFSSVTMNPYSFFNFTNNHAFNHGGAIYYHSNDQHILLTGTNCFLRNKNESLAETITVIFEGNTAGVGGSAVYSVSFFECRQKCFPGKRWTQENLFKCVGNFTYKGNKSSVLTTSGVKFNFISNKQPPFHYSVIPGDQVTLPFTVIDELNQTVTPLMSFNISSEQPVQFRQKYTLNKTISPLGIPPATSSFSLIVLGVRKIFFQFNITLLPCPPGLHIKEGSCTCASGSEGYAFVIKCRKFHAKIINDVWVGYIPQTSTHYTDLYSAPCGSPICDVSDQHLPESSKYLTNWICGSASKRRGIMCGQCFHNHSSYYHSRYFACGPNNKCYFGMVFYILSEIIPMVVFFVIIVIFDLNFTTGYIASFIFFAQNSDQMTIPINELFTYLRVPYQAFYGLFNFEFFEMEQISFCLWTGASLLDIVAFKYVTIVIAFGLVLVLVRALHNNTCSRLCNLRARVSTKTSVVHGLSAFLVICYAQCTRTSFYILKLTRPVGYIGKQEQYYTYYGGLPYFQSKHLTYAIPALFSLIAVTILPPLILLFHPLIPQLLSLCKLGDHWIVEKILCYCQINRLMPFIDCFQSYYKDELRFFAGLYFVYRVVILACFALETNISQYGMYIEVILIIILGIHSTVQPYKKRVHNIIESLVLLNLSLINACAIISKGLKVQLDDPNIFRSDVHVLVINSIQLILLYLPMVILLFFVFFVFLRKRCQRNNNSEIVEVNDVLEGDSYHSDTLSSLIQSK